MKTNQAEYKTDIARLARQLAERDKQLLLAVIGAIAVGITILGVVLG